MSLVKRRMEAEDSLRSMALDILVEAGLLEECEFHAGTYYDSGGGELEDAYKLANSKITRGEIDLPGGMSRRDFTDAIKDTYADNSGIDYCSSCDKNLNSD